MTSIIVKHLHRPLDELIRDLHPWQGGYSDDTGHWVIKCGDGTIKKYVPDEDMKEANQHLHGQSGNRRFCNCK